MIGARAALHPTIDASVGGVLLANMLEGWLDGEPPVLPTMETADELENCRTSSKQTCLHLFTPIDAGSSTPPSGEHGTPIRAARDGEGAGLERILDPHTRPRLGKNWDGDDKERTSRPWLRMSRWVRWGRCLRWKPRDWRARTSIGIGCWSCVRSRQRW